MHPKRKSWQADYAPSIDEDSEGEESEPAEQQKDEDNEETVHIAETVEARHSKSTNAGKETIMEQQKDFSLTGSKRAHESENSDSDKDKTSVQPAAEQASKALIVVAPQQGGWTEVKTKKRGKKGKLEDYYKIPNS